MKSLQSQKKAILVEKQPSHDFSFILALPLFLELAMLPTQCYIVWTELELLDGFYSGFPVFWSLSLGPSRVFLEKLQALPCNFTNSQQTSQKQSRNRCSSIFVGHSCRNRTHSHLYAGAGLKLVFRFGPHW